MESLAALRCRAATRPDPAAVLDDFFGETLDPTTLGVTGLHHVAFYLGDYDTETEVDAWWDALHSAPGVDGAARGPSHIAPRHYGTPGWWFSCRLDGAPVELFTCRAYGAWAGVPAVRKHGLMSHPALSVRDAGRVETLLRWLARRPGLRLLAFNDDDPLGHVYGHLLDTRRHRVLELVHDTKAG
jgi:hypothetical protein